MLFYIIAGFVAGAVNFNQIQACQGLGVGCSVNYSCCTGLTCVLASSAFGFCQGVTTTMATPMSTTAAMMSTASTTLPSKSTRAVSTVTTTANTIKVNTTRATTQNAGSTTGSTGTTTVSQSCQGLGVGCSAGLACCAGMTCVITAAPWGFCQTVTTISTGPTTTPPNIPGALVTQTVFNNAVTSSETWYPVPTTDQYVNFVQRATPMGNITDKRELAMFLANILLESGGLTAKIEGYPGPPPPASWYSYPPLDVPGQSYYGRGYIQLSWSYNYLAASQALYGDNRLLTNPDQVATNETIAWDVSYWYWATYVHNQPGISQGQFGVSINAINGALECGPGATNQASPQTRWQIYQNIFNVFGIAGTPNEHGCWD